MENSFSETQYTPIPHKMRGTFCEIALGDKTRFIEINYMPYSEKDVSRLKQMDCLMESPLGEYLSKVDITEINANTFFLYKITTYLGDAKIKDPWLFNESILQYEEFVFLSFNELMRFCQNNWGIGINHFVPLEETNIP